MISHKILSVSCAFSRFFAGWYLRLAMLMLDLFRPDTVRWQDTCFNARGRVVPPDCIPDAPTVHIREEREKERRERCIVLHAVCCWQIVLHPQNGTKPHKGQTPKSKNASTPRPEAPQHPGRVPTGCGGVVRMMNSCKMTPNWSCQAEGWGEEGSVLGFGKSPHRSGVNLRYHF